LQSVFSFLLLGAPAVNRLVHDYASRFHPSFSAPDGDRQDLHSFPTRRSSDLVDARGEEIAVGVERAAAFLATASRSAGGLGRVYTIGGGARVPGLNEALSNRLRVPVELASPVQRLKVRDSVFESVAVDEVAPLLMLSVGLALRRAA